MFFLAIIGSFVLAGILKLLAMLLSIEKRDYWQCYRAVFFSFCLLTPFIIYGLVADPVLLFFIKFIIFGVAVLLGLNTSLGKSAIVAAVFSFIVTVSVNPHNENSTIKQSNVLKHSTNVKLA